MSKYRKDYNKADANQPGIVEALEKIPGVTVQTGMDDILVGYKGKTFWFEVKIDEAHANANSKTVRNQQKLAEEWKGHYSIIWTLDMILEDIGIKQL